MNTRLIYMIGGTALLVIGGSQMLSFVNKLLDIAELEFVFQLLKANGLLLAGIILLITGICAEYAQKGKYDFRND